MIRVMTIEDYEGVRSLWMKIKGFGIRSIDDSKEGVERFLKRNPDTIVVAVEDGKIVGSILCGHDGRRGCLYHVCVDEDYRMKGIGKSMVVACMEALQREQINKVSLIAFTKNDVGNAFWKEIGWTKREDLNYYDFTLNEENITALCFDGENKNLSCPSVTYGDEKDGFSQSARLFDALRELDEMGAKKVYARCPDTKGMGLAVYNRLIRASGFKIKVM